MGKGRPTKGSEIVTGHDASGDAKKRVRLVLETLGGKLPLKDAAAALGISESQFHRIREDLLEGMLQAAEPKPLGRPPAPFDPAAGIEAELRARIRELEDELEIAELREVLAFALPDIAAEGVEERKKKLLERAMETPPPASGPKSPPPGGESASSR